MGAKTSTQQPQQNNGRTFSASGSDLNGQHLLLRAIQYQQQQQQNVSSNDHHARSRRSVPDLHHQGNNSDLVVVSESSSADDSGNSAHALRYNTGTTTTSLPAHIWSLNGE
jgi:hypothetical protein